MKTTRMLLSIGTMGAMLLPAASLAAVNTNADVSASAAATVTANMSDSDFLNTFVSPVDTQNGFNAEFDARAFTAHPCFNAVGAEQEYCLELFGVTSDFETMIDNNMLGELVIQHVLDNRCRDLPAADYAACRTHNVTLLPDLLIQFNLTGAVLSDNDEDMAVDDEPVMTQQETRRMRMERLWELCEDHMMSQVGCYQSYIGSINRATLSEIENAFGNNTADARQPGEEVEENSRTSRERADMTVDSDDDTADTGTGTTITDDNNDVQSETFDEGPATRRERSEWLWDLCADSSVGQSICFRSHYRTAINADTDLAQLEEDIQE